MTRKTSLRDRPTATISTRDLAKRTSRHEMSSATTSMRPATKNDGSARSTVASLRPALSGVSQWASDVAASDPHDPVVAAVSGLVRKRSLKETSSTSNAQPSAALRRTKTTVHVGRSTETSGAAAAPTGVVRPRTSIYALSGAAGGKATQSVDVLPLARAPSKAAAPASSTDVHGLRTRPSSIYKSKAGPMSTSAVNELPRTSSSSSGQRTVVPSSSRSLLRRPSITATHAPPPPSSSSQGVVKSLSRVGSSLLRSKSRSQLPSSGR